MRKVSPLVLECNPEYSIITEDQKDYYIGWVEKSENETIDNIRFKNTLNINVINT